MTVNVTVQARRQTEYTIANSTRSVVNGEFYDGTSVDAYWVF